MNATINAEASVSELFDRYISHRSMSCCPETIQQERMVLEMFLTFAGDLRISQVTSERADAFRTMLLGAYMSNTARLRLCIVRAAFQYAVILGIILRNPFIVVKIPKPHHAGRVIPDQVLKAFFKLLPDRVRRVVKLCLFTGMRRKEAVLLGWSEVVGSKIILPPDRTKNRKGAIICLNRAALRCLGKRRAGRVFDVSLRMVNYHVTKTWRRLGMGKIRIHDMRHTFSSRHYERNHDPKTLMKQCQWSSENAAKPYDHLPDKMVKKAVDRVTFRI